MKPVRSLRLVIRFSLPGARSSFIAPILTLIALGLVATALTAWHLRQPPASAEARLQDQALMLVDRVPQVPERLVYPFSVVPGGVGSREEAADAASHDAVVGAHYKGINLDEAWMTENAQTRFVHVSYRKGDQIFWSRNKVRLLAGERLLTDGRHEVRARCGNRIAEIPLGGVEPVADAPREQLLIEPVLDEPVAAEGHPLVPVEPVISMIEWPLDLGLNSGALTLDGSGMAQWGFNGGCYQPWGCSYLYITPQWPQPNAPFLSLDFPVPHDLVVPPDESDEEPESHTETPEPSTLALFTLGAGILHLIARSRLDPRKR